jgi:hypothetical protein
MEDLAITLFLIVCTPFGWLGMIALGYAIKVARK